MNLIDEAFKGIYPEKTPTFKTKLKYSKAFKGYNANIKLHHNVIESRLSNKWKPISKEIQLGLIQSLLIKLFKEKKNATNIDIYNNFIKNVHLAIPKTHVEPMLQDSFKRVNEGYFSELIEQPNLVFNNSINKLGSYEYGSDTITISRFLKDSPQEVMDYIMYHEMLHKKHKFNNRGTRQQHHTKAFREEEKTFENSKQIENKLKKLVIKNKTKNIFSLIKTKMFL